MKISIITPSYNQARYITDTIESVLRQGYPDVQHIVMDGGSTDGTVDILRRYGHLQWVSEKDNGQSAAINEGFRRADGDILAWLNSDDYYDEGVLRCVAEYFAAHPECAFVYGNITFVDSAKTRMFESCGAVMTLEGLRRNPDVVRQPSCFWRRNVIAEVGMLDESLHLVMDYEFFLRIAKRYELHHIDKNLSFYRCYSSNKSLSLQKRQWEELRRIMTADDASGASRYRRYIAYKRFDALKQWVKRRTGWRQ